VSTPDAPQDEQAGLESDEARADASAVPAEAELTAEPVAPPAEDGDTSSTPAGDEPDGSSVEADPVDAEGVIAEEPARDPDPHGEDVQASEPAPLDATAESELDEPSEPEPEGAPAAVASDAAEVEVEEDAPPSVLDRGLVEALLFAADEPLTPAQIKKVLGGVETSEVRAVLEAIRAELDDRKAGFALIEVAGGFQFRTRAEFGGWIRQLRSDKPPKLSKPALETLAVVSYKQPVTRAEIEAIRRVDTGAVLKTLLDRRLLKVVGTKDVPGRPALYGTSKEFLEVFRLKSLKELPTLKEIRDVAVEMGDALDVPRELLPEDVAAALPPLEGPEDMTAEAAAEPGEEGGEPVASAEDDGAIEPPAIAEEPSGSDEHEPAPSPPSAEAEED
jgi:segregation and condensation protein B